ncbi:MAG: DUF4019 domain-containing protein [Xanthomonadaceae bacterium]|jgi:hypothetical protein|nr:DUF4019 domain-containing protein [Xanthomonadaceae bacterium]
MKISQVLMMAAALCCVGDLSARRRAAEPEAAPPQAQAPELTPEQQAQVQRQNEEVSNAAERVVQLVDQGRFAEIWAGVSPVAKAVTQEAEFARQVGQDRERLGAVESRRQANINRVMYREGGEVPAGHYITVVYAAKFANAAQPIQELVSFHLDPDEVWRVAGYSVR